MKNKINGIFLLVALGLISLACGGGSSSESPSTSSTIRVKGVSAGDTLKAYTLDGTMVDSSTVSSTGEGVLDVSSSDYSIRVVLEVDGVGLFESLLTTSDLNSSSINVTLNAATTVMAQELSSYYSDIFSYEESEVAAADAAAAADSASNDTDSSSALTLINSLPSNQKAFTTTVSSVASSNLGYSANQSVDVAISSTGALFVDNVSVSTTPYQITDSGYQNTVFWDTSSLKYQVYISANTLGSMSFESMTDSSDYGSFSVNFFNLAKPRFANASQSLDAILSSMFGVTSMTSFSLSESSSLSSIAAKIEMYTYLSAMALRVADEGSLSSTGWALILTAVDSALATSTTESAKDLADLIQSYLTPTTPLTTSDFGSEMLAFLGSSESVVSKLAALQSGDTVGTLSLLVGANGSLTSASALSDAEAALVSENVLEAYQYAALAVSLDPTNDQARLVSALTRMITVGVKNNVKVKAFQEAANLEYTFVGNDALEDRLDADEPEEGTVYDSADTVVGLPTLAEINDFVENAYYADLMASIADLEAINLTTFTGFDLTVEMQGKDENNDNHASSDVEFDSLDVKSILASMYLLKAKTEHYLAHNLTVDGVNTTQAAMLDLVEDAMNEDPKLTGTSTLATTWVFDNSGTELSSSDPFLNGTYSFEGGFPGELFLTNITNDDGSPVELSVYEWDDGDQWWQIMFHGMMFDPSLNGNVTFEYAFSGEATKTYGGNVYHYKFDGGMVDISGEWRWTIEITNNVGLYSVYHITETPTGSLAKSSTQSEITDATAQSWVNNNASFLTTTEAYLSKTRDSIIESAGVFNEVIDELQPLDSTNSSEDRLNNLVETPDDLEFDNMVPMSDVEIDSFQSFVGDVVNSLSGATSVDPTFLSSSMETTQVDLSFLFSLNTRDYATNSSDQAILDDGELIEDEDEIESDLADTISSSANLFGMTATVYGGNVSDLYADLGDYLDEWSYDGTTSFSRMYYVIPPETTSTASSAGAATALQAAQTYVDGFDQEDADAILSVTADNYLHEGETRADHESSLAAWLLTVDLDLSDVEVSVLQVSSNLYKFGVEGLEIEDEGSEIAYDYVSDDLSLEGAGEFVEMIDGMWYVIGDQRYVDYGTSESMVSWSNFLNYSYDGTTFTESSNSISVISKSFDHEYRGRESLIGITIVDERKGTTEDLMSGNYSYLDSSYVGDNEVSYEYVAGTGYVAGDNFTLNLDFDTVDDVSFTSTLPVNASTYTSTFDFSSLTLDAGGNVMLSWTVGATPFLAEWADISMTTGSTFDYGSELFDNKDMNIFTDITGAHSETIEATNFSAGGNYTVRLFYQMLNGEKLDTYLTFDYDSL